MANYDGHKPADSDNCHRCLLNDGNGADSSYRCVDCQHQLCDGCFKQHQTTFSTRDHTIIALQYLATNQFEVSGRRAERESQNGTKLSQKARHNANKTESSSAEAQSNVCTAGISGRRVNHITRVQVTAADIDSRVSRTQQNDAPRYGLSGRKLMHTDLATEIDHDQSAKKHSRLSVTQKKLEIPQNEVSGRRGKQHDLVTEVDHDQSVTRRMKKMALDMVKRKDKRTKQTGKPFVSLTPKQSLNVNIENDEDECRITGLVVVQDKLIVCDYNNSRLKVYDSSYRFLYEYECNDEPRDIAVIDVNTVIVSSLVGNIRLLSVDNDGMDDIDVIGTECGCSGICYYEGKIYCVTSRSEISVYTRHGRLENIFEYFIKGKVGCNDLQYFTVNPHTGIMYVTDWNKGVLVLHTTGDVIAVMSPTQLMNPLGIAVDDRGDIYVCGLNSHNMIQMSGQNVVEILSDDDNFRYPKCVHISGKKVFVAHSGAAGDKISIYQPS